MRRVACLIIVLASMLAAQRPATGGYPGAFTRFGSNARDVALAGALVADVNGGFLAFANPASVVRVQRRELGLSYLALPLGRSIQSLGIALKLPPGAAVAVSYLRAADESIQGRNSIGEKTGLLSYAEQAVGLTFSNRLTERISFGLMAKLLLNSLAGETSQGFAIDVGLLYWRPTGLSLGFRAENITGAYAWRVLVADGSREYSERLPRLLSAGLRVSARHFTFFAQADALFPEQGGVVNTFRGGLEDQVTEQAVVRIGLNHLTPTGGVGLLFSLREPLDSRVDYTLSLGKAGEGWGHLFSWLFRI